MKPPNRQHTRERRKEETIKQTWSTGIIIIDFCRIKDSNAPFSLRILASNFEPRVDSS
ncbi:hypothetical protein Fmac_021164 [Flemingia macrophylla]|uniref:Uncharacterized protein n=1 Tax=Flemingia macrophylla TaxID=520843 RepID=A0ABD1LWB6_9FABA